MGFIKQSAFNASKESFNRATHRGIIKGQNPGGTRRVERRARSKTLRPERRRRRRPLEQASSPDPNSSPSIFPLRAITRHALCNIPLVGVVMTST